jgi:hypothetical protein
VPKLSLQTQKKGKKSQFSMKKCNTLRVEYDQMKKLPQHTSKEKNNLLQGRGQEAFFSNQSSGMTTSDLLSYD